MQFRPMSRGDWPAVSRIYSAGITTGHATFETAVPAWEIWDAAHLASLRLVAEDEGRVLGWSALSPVSNRCVYTGVAEVSVYVDPDARNRVVGRRERLSCLAGHWRDVLLLERRSDRVGLLG